MGEPFKEWYNAALVQRLGDALARHAPAFDQSAFQAAVLDAAWPGRELKQRMAHLAAMLGRFLPGTYPEQLSALYAVAPGFRGFPAVVFSDFTAQFGLDYFDESMVALRFFTPLASSEFAVRPFIARYGRRMMAVMEIWALDPDEHVRRLASEGCRPRLPWGMGLPDFKRDPAPVLRILELLRADTSEYVRRSVANNLNDIAKDHPEAVLQTITRWRTLNPPSEEALIRHALRGLLKGGHAQALALTGISTEAAPDAELFSVTPEECRIGDSCELTAQLRNPGKVRIQFRLEYAVVFVNRSGRGGRRVFQWKKGWLEPGESAVFRKRHSFRDVSIRTHFAGPHPVACIVNGRERLQAMIHVNSAAAEA